MSCQKCSSCHNYLSLVVAVDYDKYCKPFFSVFATDDEVMETARGCYQLGDYGKCLELCRHVSTSDSSLSGILRAKALFHLYCLEQEQLRKKRDILPPNEFHTRHHKCYSMTKEVIVTLGEAFDSGELTQSSEASQMLDIAMQDFMLETNKLHETSRCYLCRVKQLKFAPASETAKSVADNPGFLGATEYKNADSHSSSSSEDHSKDFSMNESSTKPGAEGEVHVHSVGSSEGTKKNERTGGLRASHLFPESVIRRFAAAVPGAVGAKVCHWDTSGSGQQKKKDQLLAPKMCSQYMLCDRCEGILSRHGEAQFVRCFFDKIYDEKNPTKSKEAQSIDYDSWLYLFCLGLIFRTIYTDMEESLNAAEVHKLLCKCRECLLNAESLKDVTSKPDVYLFMSPTEDSSENSGLINMFLAGTCVSYLGLHHLDTSFEDVLSEDPVQAHFCLIHIGVVNILVTFGPSRDAVIHNRFRVSTNKGVYTVPTNEDRKRLLPKGLWTAFQILSIESERDWIESREKTYTPVSDPRGSAAETFGILKNQEHDESLVLEGVFPSVGGGPFEVTLLPSGFKMDLANQRNPLVVPNGHHILLHHSHGGQDNCATVLLGVGRGGAYSLSKPYVIWCSAQPTLVFCTGFFISPEDLSPITFLPDRQGKTSFKHPEKLLEDYAVPTANLLRCAMEEKGCHSLRSILDRLPALEYVLE